MRVHREQDERMQCGEEDGNISVEPCLPDTFFPSTDISWWALFESKFEGVSPAAGERGKVKTKLEARNKTFLNWRKEQRGEKCAGNNENIFF